MKTLSKILVVGILANMVFCMPANATSDILKIKVLNAANNSTYYDEAIIAFLPNATSGFDGNYDAYKFFSSNLLVPSVYTDIDSVTHLSINSLPAFTHKTTVDLHVRIKTSGNYTIQAVELGDFLPGVSILLKDKITGKDYNFRNGNSITLFLEANTIATSNRFVIHFSYPTIITTINASCNCFADGSVTLTKQENNDWKYELKRTSGLFIKADSNINETTTINGLEPGSYNLITKSSTTSTEYSQFIIFQSDPIVVDFSCSVHETILSKAIINFTNNSVNTNSFSWDFGDKSPISNEKSPVHQYKETGTFIITLTAGNNNCAISFNDTLIVNPDSTNEISTANKSGNLLTVFQQNDMLVVNLKSNSPAFNSITIYNSTGQTVYSINAQNTNDFSETTSLPATGTYIICAYINNDRISKKIIYHKNN